VVETYNEMNITFDPAGVVQLVEAFVPLLLAGDPLQVELTAETIGIPFVPKARAVHALGDDSRYLGIFIRFCAPDDLVDPANALCYESASGSGDALGFAIGVLPMIGSAAEAPATVRVRAIATTVAAADLELACRVDGEGPYFGFRGIDVDGGFTLTHPWLALEGDHRLTVVARDRARPGLWSAPVDLWVQRDRTPPTLTARREAGQVRIVATDNLTPAARIAVAVVIGDGGERLEFAPRASLAATLEERVTLWARDDAGNVSAPLVVPAVQAGAVPPEPRAEASGCRAAGGGVSVLAATLLGWRRRGRHTPAQGA
jgi:hypothetical protein